MNAYAGNSQRTCTVKLKLVSNFIYIGLAQAVNQFTPIAILPYLNRTIGMEAVGAIVFSQVLMNYLSTIVDYGFSISATRRVALYRDDKRELSNLFTSVLWIKIAIAVCLFLVLLIATPLIPWPLMIVLLSYPLVLGKALVPQWLFWGLEKNIVFVIASLGSKFLFFTYLFINVKDTSDAPWVNFVLGCSDVLIGLLLSLYWLPHHLSIKIKRIKQKELIQFFKEGWMVFVSNISASLYLNTGVLLLGGFVSGLNFSKYAIAERITTTPRLISGLLLQAVYPHASRLAILSDQRVEKFIVWFRFVLISLYIACGLILFFFSDLLTVLFTGYSDITISFYIQLLAILPLIVAFGIPSYLKLLIEGKNKYCMCIFLFGAIINILLNTILLSKYQEKAVITVSYITELVVACSFILVAHRSKRQTISPSYL